MFAPLVRGYLLAAGLYYCVIIPLHLLYKEGAERWAMVGIAAATATTCLGLAWRLRRRATFGLVELAGLTGNVLVLGNVLADQLLGFQDHQLFYHLLMALGFATASPTRRLAFVSVFAAVVSMLPFAGQAEPGIRDNAVFLAFTAGLVAIGMSALMRNTALRELRARLAAEELSARLQAELERNEALRRESEALALSEQAANRAKSAFLATVSHELRTPLNGVLGMAQIMEAGELSPEQRARLGTIQSSGQALLRTIDDVLDISQIEAGRLELSPAPFDLGALGDDLAALYGDLAGRKGLGFTFEISPDARGWRYGDGLRVRQVFSNLMSNALKFTEEGSVIARIDVSDSRMIFTVTDTGVGIAPEAAPSLFQKFVQADASVTRRFGGTGLGLAICREIVERMGGEIGFESAPGRGTCFRVEVDAPSTAPPVTAEASVRRPRDRSLRVLVADDNDVNLTVAETLLAPFGVVVGRATSGAEAIQAWEAGDWDAVLMDIHMPEMDGLSATAEIRRREAAQGRARTPIVALTASTMRHEIESYLAAGMDDHVAKPIDLSRLLEALDRCVEADGEPERRLA